MLEHESDVSSRNKAVFPENSFMTLDLRMLSITSMSSFCSLTLKYSRHSPLVNVNNWTAALCFSKDCSNCSLSFDAFEFLLKITKKTLVKSFFSHKILPMVVCKKVEYQKKDNLKII